jgi:hypothetical protein
MSRSGWFLFESWRNELARLHPTFAGARMTYMVLIQIGFMVVSMSIEHMLNFNQKAKPHEMDTENSLAFVLWKREEKNENLFINNKMMFFALASFQEAKTEITA